MTPLRRSLRRLPRRSLAALAAVSIAALGAVALPVVMHPWLAGPFSGPKTVVMAAVSLALLLALLLAVPRGRGRAACLVLALGYLGWWVIATAVVRDPAAALIGARGMYQGLAATACYLAAFAAGLLVLRGHRARRVILAAVVAGATVAAAYGLIQLAGLDPLWKGFLDKGRIFSTLGQANVLAEVLLFGGAGAVGLAVAEQGVRRVAAGVAAGLIVAAFLWTQSRGAYLGAVTGVVLVATIVVARTLRARRRAAARVVDDGAPADGAPATGASDGRTDGGSSRRPAGRTLGAAVVVVAVVAAIGVGVPAVLQRAAHTTQRNHGSVAMHRNLVVIGLAMAVDHPLVGVGPEDFRSNVTPYLGLSRFRDRNIQGGRIERGQAPVPRAIRLVPYGEALAIARRRPESPHNVLAAVASGVGLPAAILYVLLAIGSVVAGMRRAIRAPRREAILLGATVAAVAGWLVADQTMTGSVAPSWIGWLLAGSLAGAVAWRRSGHRREPEPDAAAVEGDPVGGPRRVGGGEELERR